jgi:O-antigen ligase
MRAAARALLLVFAFTVPWEYSLDMGPPLGNIARLVGLLLLAVAIPAVLQAGRPRPLGPVQVLAMAFYLWTCCTCLWSSEPAATLARLPGIFQEMLVVWLAWELAGDVVDLRALLRAWLAGTWVLAGLTIASFVLERAAGADQIRFAPMGQDPNDVARFLDLGLPVAALLVDWEPHRAGKFLALCYLPLGVTAVLLSASRGGFLEGLVALTGCALVLWHNHKRTVMAGLYALPVTIATLWLAIPSGTLERIATIADRAQVSDLNQRVNIWDAGWRAFLDAPFLGHGAGTFVSAAGLAPIDTAHNTALAIVVEGGVVGLALAAAILLAAAHAALTTRGPLRIALGSLLAAWCLASMVGTTGESRVTWLLFAVVALAGRLCAHQHVRAEAHVDGHTVMIEAT